MAFGIVKGQIVTQPFYQLDDGTGAIYRTSNNTHVPDPATLASEGGEYNKNVQIVSAAGSPWLVLGAVAVGILLLAKLFRGGHRR